MKPIISEVLLARDEPAIVILALPGCETLHCMTPWHGIYPLYRSLHLGSYAAREWHAYSYTATT